MNDMEKNGMEGQDEARVYELGFHIDPELSQEEVKKVYQGYKDLAGAIVAEGQPQKVQLAYTISRKDTTGRRDFDTAYFGWIAYEADAATHEKVAEAAAEDARLIRFIDLRTEKEAAAHSAEMHEFYAKLPQQENGLDEVSDAELDAALSKEVA